MNNQIRTVVLSTPDYSHLAAAIAKNLQADADPVLERKHFPDGETYLRTVADVRGAHVVLIGATQTEVNLVELITLGYHVAKNGARKLSIVIPYFGYSTMERAKVGGEVIRAKANAVMLSAIPNPPQGKHFYLTDLHAAGITEYFEGGSHVEHVYAMPAIVQTIRSILGTQSPDIIVGSADTGRVDWVESYARSLDTGLAVITKRRQDGENVELLAVGGNSVKGKIVIIYDDMIRSGGTIIKAIEAYKHAGATRVIVATSHLVLVESGPMQKDKAFDRSAILSRMFLAGATDIITTNSLPQAQNLSEWLTFPPAGFRPVTPPTPDRIVVVESSTLEKKTLHVVDLSAVYASALRDGARIS